MTEKSVCVCGAGTMGSGIAQAVAQAGFQVILYERDSPVLSKAEKSIHNNVQLLVSKNKLTVEDSDKIYSRLTFTTNITNCIADIFIEAIVEREDVKVALFNELAAINQPSSVFTTNTSSLSVTNIAKAVANPSRVAGLHFFNPATIMKLVEIVSTPQTAPTVITTLKAFVQQMGKVAVICKDSPGFIVNRVARPFYIETLRLVEAKLISFEQADRLLEASGFRMGPFKLMDLIGNDINYAVSCSVYEQLDRPERLRPSSIQEDLVKTNRLGRKSGEGYYKY